MKHIRTFLTVLAAESDNENINDLVDFLGLLACLALIVVGIPLLFTLMEGL